MGDNRIRLLYIQAMRLSETQVEKLVKSIVKGLTEKGFIEVQDQLHNTIKDIIIKNFEDEKHIEKEAQAMMEKLASQMSDDIDRHKMFHMIKKKIAAEKKFVL